MTDELCWYCASGWHVLCPRESRHWRGTCSCPHAAHDSQHMIDQATSIVVLAITAFSVAAAMVIFAVVFHGERAAPMPDQPITAPWAPATVADEG